MPIYAYACGACGFKKDVLQKLSDAPLTDCPSCGQAQFSKQLTAPGFVLKGSGWYVTDFREGQKKPTSESGAASADVTGSGSDTKPASEPSASASSAASTPVAAPASTPAPSSATSGSSGSTSAASTPAKAA